MNTSKESEKFIYFLTLEVFKDYYCPQMKLQEGNGFIPVCHSVHSGISVQGVSVQWGSLSNGGLCPGGLPRMGSLSRGVSVHGERVCLGGLSWGRSPPHTVQSGQYTSYLNAFLFYHHVLNATEFYLLLHTKISRNIYQKVSFGNNTY